MVDIICVAYGLIAQQFLPGSLWMEGFHFKLVQDTEGYLDIDIKIYSIPVLFYF